MITLKNLLYCIILITFSCTVQEDFDFIPPPIAIIYGSVTEGVSANIYLANSPTTSKNINPIDLVITDAEVKIIKNNGQSIILPYDKESLRYKSTDSLFFKDATGYLVEVRTKEATILKSSVVAVPSKPVLSNFLLSDREDNTRECGVGVKRRVADFDFTWEKEINSLEIDFISSGCDELQSIDIDRTCLLSNYSNDANILLIPFICFTSKNIKMEISHKSRFIQGGKSIVLSSKSIEYLLFWESQTDPKAFFEGFVEPKNTYTNINGGVGVFFVSNDQTIKI